MIASALSRMTSMRHLTGVAHSENCFLRVVRYGKLS
jgi:hypothetical protein